MRSPVARSSSQIGVFQTGGPPFRTSAPQMSLTSTSIAPYSARRRSARASTWSGSRWSTAIGTPTPPSDVTSSAVSSIVSGRS